VPVAAEQADAVWKVLIEQRESEQKFVRAYSYNGMHLVACQHPQYEAEAAEYFELAQADEAASVRARVRNICECGF